MTTTEQVAWVPAPKGLSGAKAAQLDLDDIPDMLGEDIADRLREARELMRLSRFALWAIGPSGSGKTHFAQVLGREYAREHNVPLYYMQMSHDVTKTTAVHGFRMVAGSYIPVKGVTAVAMEEGAVLIVDEALHTRPETLLMFNSILGKNGLTAIGDEVVRAKKTFRMIFASNDDLHIGNTRLPQSFAQRLITLRFGYPSWETEHEVALSLVMADLTEAGYPELLAPVTLAPYLTSYIREVRTPEYPLSARNVSQAMVQFHVKRLLLGTKYDPEMVDTHFSDNNSDATSQKLAKWILGKDVRKQSVLISDWMVDFKSFVSNIGLETFRTVVLDSCGYSLPIAGFSLTKETLQTNMVSKII